MMLKTLLRKQMTEIFRSYFYNFKKNEKRSAASTAMLIVMYVIIMVVFLGGTFTFLSMTMCTGMLNADAGWLYFAVMGIISIALGAFGSVFNTYSSLYISKDNDLLLSLPIPVKYIIISRLLSVYILGAMYSLVVILPACVVYWIFASPDIVTILCSLLFAFLITLTVLILSCVLGRVVAKISVKLKNRSLVAVLASLAFIAIYCFVYYKAQTLISNLIANAAIYGEKVKTSAYPLYLFGRVGEGDPIAVLAVTGVVALLSVLTWCLLSHSFTELAAASGKTAKKKYSEKSVKVKSVSSALLYKELRRFLASPNYILNSGMGAIIMPIAGIVLLIKGNTLSSLLPAVLGDYYGLLPAIVFVAVTMLLSMVLTAAPSVSLEGKTVWLSQSLPVTPWEILRAKLRLHILLGGLSSLFCAVCAVVALRIPLLQALLIILAVASAAVFSALFNLCLGVRMPNLEWTNEIAPIKQSAPTMLSMFGMWAYSALSSLPLLIPAAASHIEIYLASASAATAIISFFLFSWCKKKGSALFSQL